MTDDQEEVMSTTDVARYEPGEITPRRWEQMEREARVFAKSGKVPKEYDGKPEAIMAVLITAEELGMKAGLNALKAFHFIEGSAVPSAQLMIALARAKGHDIRTTFLDETVCRVEGRRRGSDQPEEFSYSIDQARRAGQLDPWVEQWKDGTNGKRYLDKYFLKVRGEANPVQPPAWAKALIDGGHVKVKEAWLRYPEDLLKASTIRRACRAICPDVLLGLASVDAEDLGGGGGGEAARTADRAAPTPEPTTVSPENLDDDIIDLDPVEEDEPPEAPRPFEPEGDIVSDAWKREFAIAANAAGLTADHRHAILGHATSERTRTSTELRRSETREVVRWFRAVTEGQPPPYRFVELDGVLHIGPRSPEGTEQLPLEESA